jgi:hypothetical protein
MKQIFLQVPIGRMSNQLRKISLLTQAIMKQKYPNLPKIQMRIVKMKSIIETINKSKKLNKLIIQSKKRSRQIY